VRHHLGGSIFSCDFSPIDTTVTATVFGSSGVPIPQRRPPQHLPYYPQQWEHDNCPRFQRKLSPPIHTSVGWLDLRTPIR
jgi:hypothetical protein